MLSTETTTLTMAFKAISSTQTITIITTTVILSFQRAFVLHYSGLDRAFGNQNLFGGNSNNNNNLFGRNSILIQISSLSYPIP